MVDPPPLIRPTSGPVRTGFRYDPATPFAAGQRRGTTFAARPGSVVAAPCRGRITFAGRTPHGSAVTVRCGAWSTTVLGVTADLRPGSAVAAGGTVGRASGAVVGLSLRPVAERWGYVDPRPSLATPRTGTPLGRAPRARRSPARAPSPRPLTAPRRAPLRSVRPVSAPVAAGRPVPLPVGTGPVAVPVVPEQDGPPWADPRVAGVGLALLALGLLTLRRRHRPGRRAGDRRPVPAARRLTRLWTDERAAVPSIGNGLLRHHPDLLRQRRATPRARVLDDRR